MPATTGVSAVPIGRPGGEVQLGAVPGFYLSSSARSRPQGTPIQQATAVVEPDRWLRVPGLMLGARVFGPSHDSPGEPYAGYRATVREGISIGAGLFGTSKRSTARLASYRATRVGGEAAVDAQLWESEWFGVHVQGAVSATRITASGQYCVDEMGLAIDCDVRDTAMNTLVDGDQRGMYPAATSSLAVDFAKGRDGIFDGVRLALLVAIGSMPMLKDGAKTGSEPYTAGGLTLTLGIAD